MFRNGLLKGGRVNRAWFKPLDGPDSLSFNWGTQSSVGLRMFVHFFYSCEMYGSSLWSARNYTTLYSIILVFVKMVVWELILMQGRTLFSYSRTFNVLMVALHLHIIHRVICCIIPCKELKRSSRRRKESNTFHLDIASMFVRIMKYYTLSSPFYCSYRMVTRQSVLFFSPSVNVGIWVEVDVLTIGYRSTRLYCIYHTSLCRLFLGIYL